MHSSRSRLSPNQFLSIVVPGLAKEDQGMIVHEVAAIGFRARNSSGKPT